MNAYEMHRFITPIETEEYLIRFAQEGDNIVTDLVKKPSQIIMTDSPHVFQGYTEFFKNAYGDVLVAGLGMGMCTVALENNPRVKSITMVEVEWEIIQLVSSSLWTNGKQIIINKNIFEFETDKVFDVMFFDIWMNPTKEGKDELEFLKKKFEKNLRDGGWVSCWREDQYERVA
jgi:hypothetical protein